MKNTLFFNKWFVIACVVLTLTGCARLTTDAPTEVTNQALRTTHITWRELNTFRRVRNDPGMYGVPSGGNSHIIKLPKPPQPTCPSDLFCW